MKKLILIFTLFISIKMFSGTFTITPTPSTTLDSINMGHHYSQYISVKGGTPPYSYTVVSGVPYQSIVFTGGYNCKAPYFSGTPPLSGSVGTHSVSIRVTDSGTLTAVVSYTLNFTYKRLTPYELDQIWSRSPMPPQYIDVFDTWHFVPLATNTVVPYPQTLSISGNTITIAPSGSYVTLPKPPAYTFDSKTTGISTGSTTATITLNTITVTANSLINNGDKMRVTAYFKNANNTNSKSSRLNIGNLNVINTSTVTGQGVYFVLDLIKQSGTTFQATTTVFTDNDGLTAISYGNALTGVTFASDFVVQCFGVNGVSGSAADITNFVLTIEIFRKLD